MVPSATCTHALLVKAKLNTAHSRSLHTLVRLIPSHQGRSCVHPYPALLAAGGPEEEPQAAGCGGFGKGNFHELFKRIEDYERTLNIGS